MSRAVAVSTTAVDAVRAAVRVVDEQIALLSLSRDTPFRTRRRRLIKMFGKWKKEEE